MWRFILFLGQCTVWIASHSGMDTLLTRDRQVGGGGDMCVGLEYKETVPRELHIQPLFFYQNSPNMDLNLLHTVLYHIIGYFTWHVTSTVQ